jgi:hypothetical protein
MFAGLFFPDAQWAEILSAVTFSRWGLEAAGTTADLNGLLESTLGTIYQEDPAYTYSALHLLSRWAILLAFSVVLTAATIVRQRRKHV